jgi:hypothetical protein
MALVKIAADKVNQVTALAERREALTQEMHVIDNQIAAITKSPLGDPLPEQVTLVRAADGERLHNLLVRIQQTAKRPMTIDEMANAAINAGYPTKSNAFGMVVGQAIKEHSDLFRRADPKHKRNGRYTLRSSRKATAQ